MCASSFESPARSVQCLLKFRFMRWYLAPVALLRALTYKPALAISPCLLQWSVICRKAKTYRSVLSSSSLSKSLLMRSALQPVALSSALIKALGGVVGSEDIVDEYLKCCMSVGCRVMAYLIVRMRYIYLFVTANGFGVLELMRTFHRAPLHSDLMPLLAPSHTERTPKSAIHWPRRGLWT